MAVLRRPFERARRLARKVLWECGMDEPSKIDPFTIVGRNRIEVTYARLDGASAQIFRHGDRAIIRVSDQIVQLGRLRFTIAHEVAHFLLGHKIPVEAVLDPNARAPFSVHQEREADVFATEFLMPAAWVAAYCRSPVTNLSVVHAIAQAFRVSNVAAAVRRVELGDAPCAVAYSEHGRVVWARGSGMFPGRIKSQRKIGSGSVAADYFECGALDSAPRVVAATTWFGADMAPNMSALVEHAELVPEPGWGGVLSLLAIQDDVQRPD
jgi:Zn-dependent peptidase ImmA (M78 family)